MGADRRRARQEALVRALATEELDGLLVTSRANIRYLTGFSGSAALVMVTRADVLLVTDFRYDEQARAEAGAVARVEVESTSVWDRFFKELATLGPLTSLGYEAHALTVHDAERLGGAGGAGKAWRWQATTELVERLRAAKRSEERRVGKECRCRWGPGDSREKNTSEDGQSEGTREGSGDGLVD